MIILNEAEYAEKCLLSGNIGSKPYFTLAIIAKYYHYVHGYKRKEIIKCLTDFLSKYYPAYNSERTEWDEKIEKIADNVKKYKLYIIDGVSITSKELNTIKAIENRQLEKLAFTLLCLAKLGNKKRENNNGWVNNETREIFKLARVSGNSESRNLKLNALWKVGLIEFPTKNTNLSIRVKFVDDNSKEKLFINDFRELGYAYLKYLGEPIKTCKKCGVLMAVGKEKKEKYCKECSNPAPVLTREIICLDCGKSVILPIANRKSTRCPECYTVYRKIRKMEEQAERRLKARAEVKLKAQELTN